MREPLDKSPEETTGVRARNPTLCKERKGWATRAMFPRLKSGPEHNKNWTNRLVLSNSTASVDPLARHCRSAEFLVSRFGYSRGRKRGLDSCSMGRGICIPAARNVPVCISDRKKSCGEARRQTGWGCNAGRRLARQRNIHGNHSDGNGKGICPYQCSGLAGHDIAVDNPDGDVLLRSVGRQPVRIACLDVWGASCLGSSD